MLFQHCLSRESRPATMGEIVLVARCSPLRSLRGPGSLRSVLYVSDPSGSADRQTSLRGPHNSPRILHTIVRKPRTEQGRAVSTAALYSLSPDQRRNLLVLIRGLLCVGIRVLRRLCGRSGVPVPLVGSWGGVRRLGRGHRLLGRVAHVLRVRPADGASHPGVAATAGYSEDDGCDHGCEANNADEKDDGAHWGGSILVLGMVRCAVVVCAVEDCNNHNRAATGR